MSIHAGDEVWAGKCMDMHTLGHGSGNMADDEGSNINWGFWLSKDLTIEDAVNILSKLMEELSTHSNVDTMAFQGALMSAMMQQGQ